MKKKIRIAQIGMNRYSHAVEIFRTLQNLSDEFELVGYALVEDERETCAEKLKHFAGYREMTVEEILSDPTIDAVAVETDEIHLNRYAQMVADAGKHMHMEKPGSQCLADFERLVATVKEKQTVFHLGYMYRYNPFISDAVARAQRGEYGQIYSVEAHMSRYDKDPCRAWFASFQGGMMFYLGCHLVDLVYQILGEPSEVIPCNTVTGLHGIHTEDLGFAVLKYPHAIAVVRMGGTEVGGNKRRQLVICGDTQTVEIKPLEFSPSVKRPGIVSEQCVRKTEYFFNDLEKVQTATAESEPFGRYDAMMRSFAAMVRGEKTNPYTYDYELSLFRLILRCCGMELPEASK